MDEGQRRLLDHHKLVAREKILEGEISLNSYLLRDYKDTIWGPRQLFMFVLGYFVIAGGAKLAMHSPITLGWAAFGFCGAIAFWLLNAVIAYYMLREPIATAKKKIELAKTALHLLENNERQESNKL